MIPTILGKAAIVRAFFEQREMAPLVSKLQSRLRECPRDAGAWLDMSYVLRAAGEKDKACAAERVALQLSRTYVVSGRRNIGPHILALVAPGDFMANTPIEFLLENADATLILHFVDAETASLADVPYHDVAFNAVGESQENRAILDQLSFLLDLAPAAVLNGNTEAIKQLTREGLYETFASSKNIVAPRNEKWPRQALQSFVDASVEPRASLFPKGAPAIIRRVGTHAGHGLQKISGGADLKAYLEQENAGEFFVAPFIDYRSTDGKFRKARVAFVDGKPFASHLAVSDHWMVHYLNAGMNEHPERRSEEAVWMAGFDESMAQRHANAFKELCQKIPLDYFVIDCAELPDGRLLVFEADVAMIVHAMDPPDVYPYKMPAMEKLFAAFETAIHRRCQRSAREGHSLRQAM